jgi:hypothetical protein
MASPRDNIPSIGSEGNDTGTNEMNHLAQAVAPSALQLGAHSSNLNNVNQQDVNLEPSLNSNVGGVGQMQQLWPFCNQFPMNPMNATPSTQLVGYDSSSILPFLLSQHLPNPALAATVAQSNTGLAHMPTHTHTVATRTIEQPLPFGYSAALQAQTTAAIGTPIYTPGVTHAPVFNQHGIAMPIAMPMQQRPPLLAPAAFAGTESLSISTTSSEGRCMILYLRQDQDNLSPYQCLVRKQIELFEATEKDIKDNAQGRNKPITLKQIGIRCRHCGRLTPKKRAKGAVFFTSKLVGLYQTAQNMANSHLIKDCLEIPKDIREDLLRIRLAEKGSNTRKSAYGGGRHYWASCLRMLGVVETPDRRLRFSSHSI